MSVLREMPKALLLATMTMLVQAPATADTVPLGALSKMGGKMGGKMGDTGQPVPAYILELPDSVTEVLVAETDTATLFRFRRDGADMRRYDQRYMSIGENGVGKQRAWDRRTPLGIYFVTDRLDPNRLPDRYGAAAFPLDYPNTLDRLAGRSGDGIWIHGVDPHVGQRPPLATDGCLALGNDDLLAMAPAIAPLVTPVVITPRLEHLTPAAIARLRDELKAELERWVSSFETGDLYTYLSLYAEDFVFHGLPRERWLALQLGRFGSRSAAAVTLEDLVLLKDPVEDEVYLSRFTRSTVENGRRMAITQRLYWHRSATGVWRIIAEDSG